MKTENSAEWIASRTLASALIRLALSWQRRRAGHMLSLLASGIEIRHGTCTYFLCHQLLKAHLGTGLLMIARNNPRPEKRENCLEIWAKPIQACELHGHLSGPVFLLSALGERNWFPLDPPGDAATTLRSIWVRHNTSEGGCVLAISESGEITISAPWLDS